LQRRELRAARAGSAVFWPISQFARVGRKREDGQGKPLNIEHSTSNAQHRTRADSTSLPLGNAEASGEQFADGSALVTYPNGSVLILESNLARESAVAETRDSERGV
jgi:hypothetical protein